MRNGFGNTGVKYWESEMGSEIGARTQRPSARRLPAPTLLLVLVFVFSRVLSSGDSLQASSRAELERADDAYGGGILVGARQPPRTAVDTTVSSDALVERFKSERVFWRQFEIAEEIADRGDRTVLPLLDPWLGHEDRHIRANVAFIFGHLGDPRGLEIITDILSDRSDRPEGQGIGIASSDGRYRVARQIAADRYYAAHVLGDLRDPRAISTLVPLLKDPETSLIVPWALEKIGDKRAIGPLLDVLEDDSPTMSVLAIYALEALHATEALRRLMSLLDDHRRSNFGAQVSVSDATRAAIEKLK
jgi:HEAT repeat protein